MPGITAGHQHSIDARQLLEYARPLLEREIDRFRIRIILVHRRVPDPNIESVVGEQLRHSLHHWHRRERKMRTCGVVIRARRNEFDSVAAEDGEIANVLLPNGKAPRIVRMSLRPLSELVPT